ncbi:MAG: hypothetical protein M3458_19380 [Acidobacteriota bacterium]|nr:hypothetical protein [Acidobacteriota bacterium]
MRAHTSDVSPIASHSFELAEAAEVGLEIEAHAPGASWLRKGAEAAALVVKVDGEYSQDVMLWAGGDSFTYRVTLGRLARGKHTIAVSLNEARSALGARRADISSLKPLIFHIAKTTGLSRTNLVSNLNNLSGGVDDKQNSNQTGNLKGNLSSDDILALTRSPVLYARANSIDRFTDVPLLMFYQIERPQSGETLIRYSVVFSHEDGGTPAAALMARWGRGSDIEWVYEFRVRDGRVVDEIYQGVNHQTTPFTGTRTLGGGHPLLAVASDNNNFSDLACSAVRFALLPVRADLSSASREILMDNNPWTYRVVGEEMLRENRIKDNPTDAQTIADPRDYLYIEAHGRQTAAALSLGVRISGGTQSYQSDLGDARLRIDRSGFFRTAVRLPKGTGGSAVEEISITCHGAPGQVGKQSCEDVRLSRVFMLDRDYVPRAVAIPQTKSATLTADGVETLTIRPPNRPTNE